MLIDSTGVNDIGTQVFPLMERTCKPQAIWDGGTYEMLAHAIHEDYLRNAALRSETPQTNSSMVPWNDLSENLRESNRNQAENIALKLRESGYDFALAAEWDLQPLQFPAEVVEEMAKMEHRRFVDERLREGWKYGWPKDDQKKISPTLIPWDELSEEEKDKDRDPVRSIPAFLARAGYRVFLSQKTD
jgi:hypothetical protein